MSIEGPVAVALPQRWAAVPRRWRIVLLAIGALLALELGLTLVSGVTGEPSPEVGPSSSYATSATGTKALATLLGQDGHRVTRLTASVAVAALPAHAVLFVLDPSSWTTADTRALVRFMRGGGRVVLAGHIPGGGVLRALLGGRTPPTWAPTPAGPLTPAGSSPLTAGVSSVDGGSYGTFSAPGAAVPLVGRPGDLLAVASSAGDARLVVLADSGPLENRSLGAADDALFGLDLAGSGDRVVVFDEYDHGFGHTSQGLLGLPVQWRWGLLLALGAVVVWVVSAARRFGPPEAATRALPPPRGNYIDAMGALLATLPRDRFDDASRPLRDEGRVLLCRQVGLGPDAPDTTIVHAAELSGVGPDVVTAVLHGPTNEGELLALGRAVAKLESEGGAWR